MLQAHAGIVVGLRLEELARLLVAADLHLLQLDVLPLVKRNGAHKAQVNAQTAMLARALEAYEDAVGDAHPLRTVRSTLETELCMVI